MVPVDLKARWSQGPMAQCVPAWPCADAAVCPCAAECAAVCPGAAPQVDLWDLEVLWAQGAREDQ